MSQHPRFQPQRFWTALKSTAIPKGATAFVGVSLLLSLAIAPMVLAAYKPPRSSRPSDPTTGTLVRTEGSSCDKGVKGTLTALAPLSHVGRTTATQSYSIEFTLYSYASNRKAILLYKSLLQSKKGIMQHSLPDEQSGLKTGQTYLWQVALLCNPSSPDKDQVLRTDVEVVATPATLQTSLAKTADHSQRTNLYTEAGFWYDAFAEALVADSKAKSFSIPLLEDLVKVEAAGTSEKGKQQHDRLQQVLNTERK